MGVEIRFEAKASWSVRCMLKPKRKTCGYARTHFRQRVRASATKSFFSDDDSNLLLYIRHVGDASLREKVH